ncbi:hypothetical protein D9M68_588580 [compost metagenome]
MLLGGREDKDRIGRWFFQCFQKCIERIGRKHVYLINNIDLIFSGLRRNANLFNKAPDIINRIV